MSINNALYVTDEEAALLKDSVSLIDMSRLLPLGWEIEDISGDLAEFQLPDGNGGNYSCVITTMRYGKPVLATIMLDEFRAKVTAC